MNIKNHSVENSIKYIKLTYTYIINSKTIKKQDLSLIIFTTIPHFLTNKKYLRMSSDYHNHKYHHFLEGNYYKLKIQQYKLHNDLDSYLINYIVTFYNR